MAKRNRRREELTIVMDPAKDWKTLSAAPRQIGIFADGKLIDFGTAGEFGWILPALPYGKTYELREVSEFERTCFLRKSKTISL